MNEQQLENILNQVYQNKLTPGEALKSFNYESYEDLGFAKVDHSRKKRQGCAEVVFGECKTPEQIYSIVQSILSHGEKSVLITRTKREAYEFIVNKGIKADYHEASEICIAGEQPVNRKTGKIVVATGGTGDIPVAEEAALTAEFYSNNVLRLYDVGVAGVHRLFSNLDLLSDARVVIAVAGMEGALASVIGGVVDCPVIAVPTSVGYGANFQGVAALLSMLNSCAGGVSVVNIDNGFGAGYLANMINNI